ncbi:MAG: acetoin utilization protein AcuC [Alphaproteobacteria bacterium]
MPEATRPPTAPDALDRPLMIGNDIYRRSNFGPKHPLSIPRVPATIDLARALGWLDDANYRTSRAASFDEIARFHDPAYLDALQRAERDGDLPADERQRYNLGKLENPIHDTMFRRPSVSAGAVLAAADLLAAARPRPGRPAIVYSPAGGTHHGRPDRASGFCYFNDVVLGILRLLDCGITRVFYADFDAHHGDGVQDAFADDDRVFTVSVHEAGRWPRSGPVDDRAGGAARNLPVPPGFNDSELDLLVEAAVLPLGRVFAPEIVVIQCGADALAEDPLSRLDLSNGALWRAVAHTAALADRVLVLGGGGYNPWSVARCWAGVWATVNGYAVPARLPAPAEAVLRALTWHRQAGRNPPGHWFTTLADPPRPGAVRNEVAALVAAVIQ